jgi:hypothetical protein
MSISGNDGIFTAIERGLHAALRRSFGLTAAVAENNWVDYTQPLIEPVRDSAATSDLPELRLAPAGLARQSHLSDATVWVQSYSVVVVSGDKRTSEWHNRVKEGLLRAVQMAKRSNLQLPGRVVDVVCPSIDEGPWNDDDGGARHAGWIMRATVQVRFTLADWEVPV